MPTASSLVKQAYTIAKNQGMSDQQIQNKAQSFVSNTNSNTNSNNNTTITSNSTTSNTAKDSSGKTIDDYKADYKAAHDRGDADGMEAANKGANAIREAIGETPQYANEDIARVRAESSSSNGGSSNGGSLGGGSSGGGSSNSTNKQYVGDYEKALSVAQPGSNGNADYYGTGYTGALYATTPSGQTITVNYVNGVMQNKDSVPNGTIVHSKDGQQNYIYGTAQQQAQQQVQQTGTPTVSALQNTAPDLTSLLNSWLEAARQQSQLQADYAVSQGVNELTRAQEDAQEQFATERNQIAATEAKAKDNQALYNERRGDRGGIGSAQYDAIMAAAAQNQLAVTQAQTKLSTDTARQIADLRAQGEFEKADAILELTQTYLSQLMSLKQWAAEFNLSVDEFNKQLEQFNLNYEIDLAQLTGTYRGQRTLSGQQLDASMTGYYNGKPTLELQQSLAQAGLTLAGTYGIAPSESQIAAMQSLYGYTPEQIDDIVTTTRLALQTGGSSGGGGTPTKKNDDDTVKQNTVLDTSKDAAYKTAQAQIDQDNADAAYFTLLQHYVGTALTEAIYALFDSETAKRYLGRMSSGTAIALIDRHARSDKEKEQAIIGLVSSGRLTQQQADDIVDAFNNPKK